MTDAVTKLGGSAINGFIGAWADGRRRRQEDQRALRRKAADDLLAWLPELRERLVRLESECDKEAWRDVMGRAYASVRRVNQLTPYGWQHLRRSLRDAIGNGAGAVVWIDLTPSLADADLTFDHRWTMNAVEYLEYIQAKVQTWRQAYSPRSAKKVTLLTYNDWLLRSDR